MSESERRSRAPAAVAGQRAFTGWIVVLSALQVPTLALSALQAPLSQAGAQAIVLAALGAGAAAALLPKGYAEPTVDSPGPAAESRWVALLLVLPAAIYLGLWYIACVSTEMSYDGNSYHIPPMNAWMRRGYVCWVPCDHNLGWYINGYPKAAELVAFLIARATGSSVLVHAVNLMFLPVGALGIVLLARHLGASPWSARVAGAALVLVPVNIFQANSAYVDSAFGSCIVGLLAAAVMAWTALSDGGLTVPAVLALGGACGLCLGTKSNGFVAVAVVLALVSLGHAIRLRRGAGHERWSGFRGLAVAAGLAAIVGGYWPARNLLERGNPFYPVSLHVGPFTLPGDALSDVLDLDAETPPLLKPWSGPRRVLYTWLEGLDRWPDSIKGVDAEFGGLGLFWVMACLPAFVWRALALVRRIRTGHGLDPFAIDVLVVVMLFCLTPLNWWSRRVIWLYGVGLPPFAVAMDRVMSSRGPRRVVPTLWLIGCLCVLSFEAAIAAQQVARDAYPGAWPPDSLSALRPSAWQRAHSYLLPELTGTALGRLMLRDDPVGVGPLGVLNGRDKVVLPGELSMPLGRRDVLMLGNQVSRAELEAVQAQGIRSVVWDDEVPVPPAFEAGAWQRQHVPGFWLFTMPVR